MENRRTCRSRAGCAQRLQILRRHYQRNVILPCAELELLDRTIEKLYVLPEDLKLAIIPDLQGLGGSSHSAELS